MEDYRYHDILAYCTLQIPVNPEEILPYDGVRPLVRPSHSSGDDSSGEWLVTTPNMTFIPTPPIGIREVRARRNGKYALDDRMLHPQFTCKDFDWMVCIPRPCEALADYYWVPVPDDAPTLDGFVLQTDARCLKPSVLKKLRDMHSETSKIGFEALNDKPNVTIISSLILSAELILERLASFPMNFGQLLVAISDFQRACLDVRGLATYLATVYRRMKMIQTDTDLRKSWDVDTSIMGCFTHNPEDVQKLQRVGVPVWWVRPLSNVNLGDTRVHSRALCGLHKDLPQVVLEEYAPWGNNALTFEPIYRGPPGTHLQYSTQRLGCRLVTMVEPSKIAISKLEAQRGIMTRQPQAGKCPESFVSPKSLTWRSERLRNAFAGTVRIIVLFGLQHRARPA